MNPLLLDELKPGNHTPKSSRREARETVLQVLYAYEFSQDPINKIVEDVCGPFTDQTMAFIKKLVACAVKHREVLDNHIKSRTQNWDFERIAMIDRLLLRIGICEFLHFEDIPPKVSINEVIEISKRYSTDKSSKFVNGILDSVYEDLKLAGRITKAGRGVIEE
ncbi:transcription antitermination factor NusB [bacterium]|nr:MAG: transcription antitermination factor NusB [bacterium]